MVVLPANLSRGRPPTCETCFRDHRYSHVKVAERRRMSTRATLAEDFWDRPLRDLFQTLEATPAGLTSDEANRRLRLYGPNSFVRESRFADLFSFFRLFANPLVIILVLASTISIWLGDPVGGLIIISIVLLSVLLNFSVEFQARHASACGGDDTGDDADDHHSHTDPGREAYDQEEGPRQATGSN
jgi:magnesium-transporting ATPase (P-type)